MPPPSARSRAARARRDWAGAERRVHELRKRAGAAYRSELEVLLGRAVHDNPEHPKANRVKAAKTLWNRVLERDSGGRHRAEAAYFLALAARAEGEFARAEDLCRQSLDANSEQLHARRLLRLLERRKQSAGAPREDSTPLQQVMDSGGRLMRKLLRR